MTAGVCVAAALAVPAKARVSALSGHVMCASWSGTAVIILRHCLRCTLL